MANMRSIKKSIGEILAKDNWQKFLPEIVSHGQKAVGALFSFLHRDPLISHRAAVAIGQTVAEIAEKNPEAARNIVRNYMWHMNEDSGNIGWGIPGAFAETLAASPLLAKEYSHILLSYIMDLGHADNYCDNDVLRRSCYWGIGRLAQSRPEVCEKARPWLAKGLSDPDIICRGIAAWALSQLPPNFMEVPPLRKLLNSSEDENFQIFYNGAMREISVKNMARAALERVL